LFLNPGSDARRVESEAKSELHGFDGSFASNQEEDSASKLVGPPLHKVVLHSRNAAEAAAAAAAAGRRRAATRVSAGLEEGCWQTGRGCGRLMGELSTRHAPKRHAEERGRSSVQRHAEARAERGRALGESRDRVGGGSTEWGGGERDESGTEALSRRLSSVLPW